MVVDVVDGPLHGGVAVGRGQVGTVLRQLAQMDHETQQKALHHGVAGRFVLPGGIRQRELDRITLSGHL